MSAEPQEAKVKKLSRRTFLAKAGILAAGTAVTAGSLTLVSCTQTKPVESPAQAQEVPKWPWPYQKLDVETVRKKGHLGYYHGACCYGAFWAIINELQEKVGFPYNTIPAEIMKYGEGGVVGWASLCGALNGAAAAITLVSGEDVYNGLVHELMGWYTEFAFPSDKSNQYAQEKAFLVDKYKSEKVLGKSVSGSPLCHVSVTNWCKETGFASGSPERSERCARLTGDVAAYAVELLNAQVDGKFASAYELPAAVETCRSCHSKGKDFEVGGWTRGKMSCEQCHDPHF